MVHFNTPHFLLANEIQLARQWISSNSLLQSYTRGLIYNHCIGTKRGPKQVYATFHTIVVIYKNKLDGGLCTLVRKLGAMRKKILETGENGDADGEVVN